MIIQFLFQILAHRWNELLSTVKNKTKFLQDLKDFQDSQEAMNNWLNQKEKMFLVLGPIASDPRMVQSQIQQVQVRLTLPSIVDIFKKNNSSHCISL